MLFRSHLPMPRMTNTFMTNGEYDPNEIIQSVKKGLYMVNFGGGQVDISLFPNEFVGNVWPPKDIETFDPWDIPLINTLVLLLSGTTVTWAHHSLLEDDRKGFIQGLTLTVILGFFFTLLQAYEYHHATFTYSGHIYGAVFYMATGFHGFHVIIGTIFLAVCLWRGRLGHFTKDHHFGFEAIPL